MFSKIFIPEISNIPLILYFSHIFIFNVVLEIISQTIYFFLKINVSFHLTVPFCLQHYNVIHWKKAYDKTNILTYDMLKSVANVKVKSSFLNIFGIIKLTKYLLDRKKYMNELVSPRTMGSFNRGKVPSDWSLFVREVYSGVPRTAF